MKNRYRFIMDEEILLTVFEFNGFYVRWIFSSFVIRHPSYIALWSHLKNWSIPKLRLILWSKMVKKTYWNPIHSVQKQNSIVRCHIYHFTFSKLKHDKCLMGCCHLNGPDWKWSFLKFVNQEFNMKWLCQKSWTQVY